MLEPQDIRHIKDLLERGENLPRHYKNILFPPQRQEAELVYAAKERKEDVLAGTMGIPLQTIRAFGNAKADDWYNKLIFGDNLQAMKTLLKRKHEGLFQNANGKSGIKLVYIDPPFATEQEFSNKNERAYADKVAGAAFIEFLRKRLIFIYELLSDDGALYLHLDSRKVHYMKVVLDELFGESGQTQEIIWKRTSAHSDSSSYSNVHETILFYPKSSNFYYNPIFQDYDDEYVKKRYKHSDPDGRRYMDDNLTASGLKGGGYTYEWNGHIKEWRCPIETMRDLDEQNKLYYTRNGVARIKRYLEDAKGVAPQDMYAN